MKVVLQKVKEAQVQIDSKTVGKISNGFLLLVGVTHDDTEKDADWLLDKILKLRLFSENEETFMEKNILEKGGQLLIVSQFTLFGDSRKGTRPSFTHAAPPEQAEKLYTYFVTKAKEKIFVETGVFGAHMEVNLVNDGPITLILDTQE